MSGGFRSRSESARHSRAKESQSRTPQGKKPTRRGTSDSARQSQNPQQSNQRSRQGRHRDVARFVAYSLLEVVGNEGAYGNLALTSLIADHDLHGRDAAFATELGYGTLRAQGLLDAVIGQCSSRPLGQIDGQTLNLLRLGTYQLLRTRVGVHAAVNTTVDLAGEVGKVGAKGFINAVLRAVASKSESEWIATLSKGMDPIDRIALSTAHPTWIAKVFAESLGESAHDELAEALAADDERPLVHLVARPGEITASELALICGGEETKYSPYGVILPDGDPGKLEPVRDRMASVQDEGSQLIARSVVEAAVDGKDHGRWLDLCAGPGGKAALLGALAAIDGAHVDAIEPSDHRAKLVEKSCSGLPVDVHVADGRDPGVNPGYDRILVDAPCSGLGSLRRRPEARWRKKPSDIDELVTLQRELMKSAATLVRDGGIVVYSTCSPHVRETRDVVEWVRDNCGLEPVPTAPLMRGMPSCQAWDTAVQMWPHRHGTDAMFLQVFSKPASSREV